MVGKKIKELRKKHSLDQKELGDKLGLSPSTIGMYEHDRRTPDIKTLKKISDIFDISISYFFDEPKRTFSGEELSDRIPDEYRELFEDENLHYIKFAKEMKKNRISKEQLEEIAKFILNIRDTL